MPDITRLTYPRLVPHRWCDNGMIVSASVQNQIVARLNQTMRWRRKELFRYVGQVASIAASGGAGQRDRWHGAFHSGPLAAKLGIYSMMALQRTGAGDPYSQLKIDGGASTTFHYGNVASGSPANDTPFTFGHNLQFLDLTADTDYEWTWSDFDNGRLISGMLFEVSEEPSVSNGFLERGVAVLGPIYDTHREDPMPAATTYWKRGGAHVFNWTVDLVSSPRTRTSTTDINLIDNSSTAVSAATPGYVLDFRYKNRRSQTTVPLVLKVFGKTAGGGTGHVYIKDSGASVVATVNINSTTDDWYSTTWNATASEAKYDLVYDGDGVNLTTVYAASCYEHMT